MSILSFLLRLLEAGVPLRLVESQIKFQLPSAGLVLLEGNGFIRLYSSRSRRSRRRRGFLLQLLI